MSRGLFGILFILGTPIVSRTTHLDAALKTQATKVPSSHNQNRDSMVFSGDEWCLELFRLPSLTSLNILKFILLTGTIT